MNRQLATQVSLVLMVFGFTLMITTTAIGGPPYVFLAGGFLSIVGVGFKEEATLPDCKWCHGRHRGRCMWNPRSGRVFSNHNDGYFDINDPNK